MDGGLYPQLCSRSSFKGAAVNTYYVSEVAFHPSVFTEKLASFDPRIEEFIAHIHASNIAPYISKLANGPRETNDTTWVTRNSYANGNATSNPASTGSDTTKAVNWIASQMRAAGASVEQRQFRTDMCNNVIATFPGSNRASEIVIIGSHHDSRNTNNTDRTGAAPGADDNGSGTASNLLIAFLLNSTGMHRHLNRTIQLHTYCGEEQGLLGSQALSNQYNTSSPRPNIIGMINVDMVGYKPNSTATRFWFMNGSTNLNFTNYGKSICDQYPVLRAIGHGNTGACCSDQQSWNRFWPALSLFETQTNSYPDYHRSTDTPDKVNNEQVALNAKLAAAIALSLALVV
jgi:leucyl aminopeptidase